MALSHLANSAGCLLWSHSRESLDRPLELIETASGVVLQGCSLTPDPVRSIVKIKLPPKSVLAF